MVASDAVHLSSPRLKLTTLNSNDVNRGASRVKLSTLHAGEMLPPPHGLARELSRCRFGSRPRVQSNRSPIRVHGMHKVNTTSQPMTCAVRFLSEICQKVVTSWENVGALRCFYQNGPGRQLWRIGEARHGVISHFVWTKRFASSDATLRCLMRTRRCCAIVP